MEAMTGSGGAALSGEAFWRSPEAAAPAAAQALRAQRTHPAIVWLGPVYGVVERTAAGWRMDHMSCSTPQEARDSLGYQLRTLARRLVSSGGCNEEVVEGFGGGGAGEGAAGPGAEFRGGAVELCLGDGGEVGDAFGVVVADQAVGVLVGAALPG